MKLILVNVFLASLITLVYGGVGIVTPEIESRALALWQRFCGGAQEGGTDGNSFIYCKRSPEVHEETLQHNVELPRGPAGGEQVVFVQPPSYHYKHDVVVSGGGGSQGRTIIYVKPAKNTHEVNVQDQTQPLGGPSKPQLFFLKGNHGGESQSQVGSQPQRPPPPPPPPQQGGYNYAPPQRGGLRY